MHPGEKENPRGSYLFWIISYTLFAICICNVVLTFYLISVFEIGRGMKYIEIADADTTNFYGSIDLGHLVKQNGILESFAEPLIIDNDDENTLKISLVSRIQTIHEKFSQTVDGTTISTINNFEVRDNDGKEIFNVQRPTFRLEKPIANIESNLMTTNVLISSAIDETLTVSARNNLDIKGNEGTLIEAREVFFAADKDLNIVSENGSLQLVGAQGMYLDIDRLPKADKENGLRNTHIQYKICVCYPSGELFRLQARGRDTNCVVSKYNSPCS